MANHFVQCLRLIDSERFEAARLSLTPRSRGLLPYGDPDVIRAIMLEILDIWS